jgi:hypothetical protein
MFFFLPLSQNSATGSDSEPRGSGPNECFCHSKTCFSIFFPVFPSQNFCRHFVSNLGVLKFCPSHFLQFIGLNSIFGKKCKLCTPDNVNFVFSSLQFVSVSFVGITSSLQPNLAPSTCLLPTPVITIIIIDIVIIILHSFLHYDYKCSAAV